MINEVEQGNASGTSVANMFALQKNIAMHNSSHHLFRFCIFQDHRMPKNVLLSIISHVIQRFTRVSTSSSSHF
ncbi:MAG: hypothetical protein A3E82_01525 [Gammaproteobacteria bacterium RIFCSPHIGHO2_12_FULL_38_11]|nr:MAG: hypothetical protein A3E82_01525 [Gammaproteobacteria bacterium RIFCSPHIGHO2_12_FULL_38_11]